MKQKIILEIIIALLILLFVYAACSKLLSYHLFTIQLSNSPFLKPIARGVTWALPSAELITAGLLTVRNTRLFGLLVSFVLLLVFSLYITYLLLSGIHLPCSCGGVLKQLSWKQHLWFNVGWLLLNGWAIALRVQNSTSYDGIYYKNILRKKRE